MSKLMRARAKKAGLPPGSLVHIGEPQTGAVKLTLVKYGEAEYKETPCASLQDCLAAKDSPGIAWVRVEGLQNVEVIRQIGDALGLHPLVQEDILNTDQRPKMEDFEDYLYVVLKQLSPVGSEGEIATEQVSLVLGPNFVLSFLESESSLFNPIQDRIRNDKGRHRKMGADYLAYTLLDTVVDRYFIILEDLGERVEFLEEEVVTQPDPGTLQGIHQLKRDMVFLRRSVWPLREVVTALGREDTPLVSEGVRVYFRDVYDHTIQVIDIIETFRDMVSGMLDIYLSSLSNKMNEVMKVLTIIATIFIPLTLITSLYGMNFEYMPELKWRWGYPAVLVIMVAVVGVMLAYFRRRRWL
jgi:magnesium transporter